MSTLPARLAAPLAALLLVGCGAGASVAGPVASSTVAPGPLASSDLTPAGPSATASPSVTSPAPGATSSTSTATHADPFAVQRVRPCRAEDLRAGVFREGATATWLLEVTLVARPGVVCRLDGFPRVTVVARGWTVRTVRTTVWDGGADPVPFVVRPGRPGTVTFGWNRMEWCPPGMAIDRLDVRMPGGGTLAVEGFGPPRCDAGTRAGAAVTAPVLVGGFFPER